MFGAGDLNSPKPYGLTKTERVIVKNKKILKNNEKILQKNKSILKNVPETIIKKRKRLHRLNRTIREKANKINAILEVNKENNLELIIKNTDPITRVEQMTSKDFLKEKWLFFDIEIPLFQNEQEAEISWVGMTYWSFNETKNKDSFRKEIHTLRDVGQKTLKGFKIYHYKTERELAKGVSDSIKKQNPYVVSAYNAKFDILHLRETDEFLIGYNDKSPYENITTPFFEGLALEGREIVDLLRWAKTTFDYLPNKKLELITRTTLPEINFTKSISYEEMATKELIAKYSGDSRERTLMAKEIAEYLIGDVDIMPKLFLSEEFQSHFEFSCELSEKYNISIDKFLYSHRSINKIQERRYFKDVGIPRDHVLYRTLKSRKEVIKAKQDFRKYLEGLNRIFVQPGIYSNVHLVYLHYGKALENAIITRVPEAKYVLDKRPKNPVENHLFGRFKNALAEWIISDIIIFKKKEKAIHKRLVRKSIEETYFFDVYISQKIAFEKNRIAKKQMNIGRVSVKQLVENMDVKTKHLTDKYDLSYKEFLEMFELKRQFLKFRNRFRGRYGVDENFVEKSLKKQIVNLQKFVSKENLKIIHQEGPYDYIQGDVTSVRRKYPSLIIKDFDKVIITKEYAPGKDDNDRSRKIFYETYGVFKGLKKVDHGTHLMTVFEQNTIGGFIKNVLSKNYDDAISLVEKNSERIYSNNVDNIELLLFTKGKNRYSAFENGRRIYFFEQSLEDSFNDEDIFVEKDSGRPYVNQFIRGSEERIYFMDKRDFSPDWCLYQERFKNYVLNTIHSLVGDEVKKLLFKPEDRNLFSQFDRKLALEQLISKEFQ